MITNDSSDSTILNRYSFLKFVITIHICTAAIFYLHVGKAITVLNASKHCYSRQNTQGLTTAACLDVQCV